MTSSFSITPCVDTIIEWHIYEPVILDEVL